MENTEIMTTNTGIVRSVDDLARIGKMMAVSGTPCRLLNSGEMQGQLEAIAVKRELG